MAVRSSLVAMVAAASFIAVVPAQAAGTADARDVIVVLEPTALGAEAATDALERATGVRARLRFRRALAGFAARVSASQAARLRRSPLVARVTPDRARSADAGPAPGELVPPGVRRVGASADLRAAGVQVAVLDSGIDLAHPDLDAVHGTNCQEPGRLAVDDNGHGTHVAGTIGARNTGTGLVGVAPGTRLVAVKVLDSGADGLDSHIICGIDWVTGTRTDGDPANDIAVANMSLSGPNDDEAGDLVACQPWSTPLHLAICRSVAAGVTYVASAGNQGGDFDDGTGRVPASFPEVLTVAAMADTDGAPGGVGPAPACGGTDDHHASFSNFARTSAGAAHLIAAPGVCVVSSAPGGGTRVMSGTSMAAPHVTGTVALCLADAAGPGPCAGLAPAQIIQRVRTLAADRTAADPAYGFYGDPLRPSSTRIFGHLLWTGWATAVQPGAEPAPEPEPSPAPAPAPAPAPVVHTMSPTGYTIPTGTIWAGKGALSRMFTDDGDRLEVTAVRQGTTTTYASELVASAAIPAADRERVRRVAITVDGNVRHDSGSLTISVWDAAAGAWRLVHGPRSNITSDVLMTWETTTAPADLVSASGELRVMMRAVRAGDDTRQRIDVVRFVVETG